MNHPNPTCAADCDACRNRKLAEAFQIEADKGRDIVRFLLTTLQQVSDLSNTGVLDAKDIKTIGDWEAVKQAREFLGIYPVDDTDDEPEMKQCRHCRKWFPVDDPYCKCDADQEKIDRHQGK